MAMKNISRKFPEVRSARSVTKNSALAKNRTGSSARAAVLKARVDVRQNEWTVDLAHSIAIDAYEARNVENASEFQIWAALAIVFFIIISRCWDHNGLSC